MKSGTVLVSLLAFASAAWAEKPLREISWDRLKAQGALAAGEVLPSDAEGAAHMLRVTATGEKPMTVPLASIESPGVTGPAYALVGLVRCEGVEPKAYLEMWNFFPGGGRYFTRTLAATGPMRSLEGTCGWRRIVAPFFIRKANARPDRLVLNLVLPGRGTVCLGPMRLVQYAEGEDPMALPGQWWSERAGGLVGAAIGVVGGCVGALIGLLSSRGKASHLVLGVMVAAVAAGVGMLILGVVAVSAGQPYGVWYPLLLGGVVCTAVIGGLLPVVRKRYRALELRKMAAQDVC